MIRKATLKDKHEVIAIYEAAIDLISKQGSRSGKENRAKS